MTSPSTMSRAAVPRMIRYGARGRSSSALGPRPSQRVEPGARVRPAEATLIRFAHLTPSYRPHLTPRSYEPVPARRLRRAGADGSARAGGRRRTEGDGARG